jgi:hypothetical protein
MYIIDQAGDLYYDSGNPDIGIYAVSGAGGDTVGFLQQRQLLVWQ